MCIIHDSELHHVYQNVMEAFEQSKMISALFLRRVGCLVCNCKKDMLYDSRTLISTQRSMYKWFDETLVDPCKEPVNRERLAHFKPIIEEFRQNGRIDSGTKITFIALLKDLDAYDFSKLRRVAEQTTTSMVNHRKQHPHPHTHTVAKRMNVFFTKLVKLKFDLKLCSIKEFCELLLKIDNCAIKYIQLTNKCKITLRDIEHLTIRHFMGEIDATIETRNEKNLYRAELSLKRLADAVHYRLAKQIPCSDHIVGGNCFGSLKILLQSPPQSLNTTRTTDPESSATDLSASTLSSSCASSSLNTTNNTTSSYTTNTSDMTTTTTTSTSNTSYLTATTTDLSTSRSSNTIADSSLNSSATPVSSSSSSKGAKKSRRHRRSPKSAGQKAKPAKSGAAKSKSKSKSPVNRADESVSSNSMVVQPKSQHQKTSPSSGHHHQHQQAKKSHSHHQITTTNGHHHHHQHEAKQHQKAISNSGRSNTMSHLNAVTKSNEKKKTHSSSHHINHHNHHNPNGQNQNQHRQRSNSPRNSGHYNLMADNLNLNFKKSRSSYSYKHPQFNMIDNLAY